MKWTYIYYKEEYDTDGKVLKVEWTEETDYLTGKLVKHTHVDKNNKRTECMTFIQLTKDA